MVPKSEQLYLDGQWFAENIKFNHGSLGSSYFLWGDGQKLIHDSDHTQGDTAIARKNGMSQYAFISEADSPSYLYLINTGLGNIEDPSNGGWVGRFIQSKTNPRLWEDGANITDFNFFDKKDDAEFPQSRWVEAIQNDFAARIAWCVHDYKNSNHAPVVILNSAENISAKAGTIINLSGSAKDPDGNTLAYKWWQYKEAGTYHASVDIQNPDSTQTCFTIPQT